VEIFPGRDDKNRVAKLKTQNGILVRPFQRLYPLEISDPLDVDVSGLEQKSIDNNQLKDNNVRTEKVTRSGRKVKIPYRYGQV